MYYVLVVATINATVLAENVVTGTIQICSTIHSQYSGTSFDSCVGTMTCSIIFFAADVSGSFLLTYVMNESG